MAMLDYSQIKERAIIVIDGIPHEVLSSHVFRKQQRKPVNNTKLRNLLTGKVTERSFHQSEKAEAADIISKKIKYLYAHRGESWFCDENDPGKRFQLTQNIIGEGGKFLKQNTIVDGLVFNDEIIGLKFPIKVELLVKEAPPKIIGNTVSGGTKQVILETGAAINTPLFVEAGDLVRINTETGEYVERVEKR